MTKSKFFVLLRTLNKRELSAFDRYLHGLYPGKVVQQKIFDYIKTEAPDFTSEKLYYQTIISALFNKENTPKRKITDCLSDLHLLLQEFLVWKEVKNQNFAYQFALLNVYKERQLDQLFTKHLQLAKEKLTKEESRYDETDYLHLLLLESELFSYSNSYSFKEQIEQLKQYMYHLDHFFITLKLKLSAEMRSRTNFINEENNIHLLTEVKYLAKSAQHSNNPIHQIFPILLDLFEQPDDTTFHNLKKLVINKKDRLSTKDFKLVLLYLINFSASKIRNGRIVYFKEVFELYKIGIESRVFFENNRLPYARFINIIDVASNLGYFDFAEEFIENHQKNLDDKFKEGTVQISKARLCFSKRDYEKTIELLRDVKFKDLYFGLRARTLMLRSYYELKEPINLILDFCLSFEQYIRRDKFIGQSVKSGYLNLIKMVRHLLKEKKNKAQLENDLKSMEFLTCKEWIKIQIEKKA